MTDVACIVDSKSRVTESPVWNDDEQALYWTEIYKPAVHRLDTRSGKITTWKMPDPVGCIAFRRRGGLICGTRAGFATLDTTTGTVELLYAPEPDKPNNRLNDGRCDRAGRFWAGSMDESLASRSGSLYRFDANRKCTKMVEGLIVSNGLAWSPDNRTLYHSDSRQRTVWAWDFDIDSGDIRNQRVFHVAKEGEGRPDGAAVDEEGCYWIARYAGWRLVRHAPDGREIQVVKMPVESPTMCAFGGPKRDILYVTSAGQNLTDPARQPQAGGVFMLTVGVRGLPEPRYAG